MKDPFYQMLFWIALPFIVINWAYSAECTAISRTNNAANAVLTSTKYNTDHNNAYTSVNDLRDSTCTIPLASITPTDVAPLVKAVKDGCTCSKSDANTMSVDKCIIGVDDSLVETTIATTVAFGCTSCSTDAARTTHYVYAANGSTGTTLNLLILDVAPNNNGYDSSDNRVLCRFYNDKNSAIDSMSIDLWKQGSFGFGGSEGGTDFTDFGVMTFTGTTTDPTKGDMGVDRVLVRRIGGSAEILYQLDQSSTGGVAAGSGDYILDLPGSLEYDATDVTFYTTVEGGSSAWVIEGVSFGNVILVDGTNNPGQGTTVPYDANSFRMFVDDIGSAGAMGSGYKTFTTAG